MKLLSMSGLIPEQICDTVRFTQYTGERNISHYCGYASDFISQVIKENDIDGAVYPKSCDSSRIISNYLENCGKFTYQFNIPSRQDKIAIDYFSEVIKEYKKHIETYFHIEIKDVIERTENINRRNAEFKKLYEELDEIRYSEYLTMIHNLLVKPLAEQKISKSFSKAVESKKRIYLVGSFLSNLSIIKSIEQYHMKIVGDNLTESGRLTSMPQVELEGDIYQNISKNILEMRLSPTQNNFKRIIEKDLDEIKKKNVNGVIFIVQKYCESYEYLFSIYKKYLDDIKIPTHKIVLLNSEDNHKITLQLEAFADSI